MWAARIYFFILEWHTTHSTPCDDSASFWSSVLIAHCANEAGGTTYSMRESDLNVHKKKLISYNVTPITRIEKTRRDQTRETSVKRDVLMTSATRPPVPYCFSLYSSSSRPFAIPSASSYQPRTGKGYIEFWEFPWWAHLGENLC